MNLTSRVTTSNGEITAWVDNDNTPWIEQPFNPTSKQPAWVSEEEALAWADAWIAKRNTEGSN